MTNNTFELRCCECNSIIGNLIFNKDIPRNPEYNGIRGITKIASNGFQGRIFCINCAPKTEGEN